MPEYDYRCENCTHEFTLELSITDHANQEKARAIHCPKCESTHVRHVIQSVFVTTAKKS